MSTDLEFKDMVDDLRVSAYLACKNILESDSSPPREKRETAALVFTISGDMPEKRTGPQQGHSNYTQINFSEQFSSDQVDGLKQLFGAVHDESGQSERKERAVPTEPSSEGNE